MLLKLSLSSIRKMMKDYLVLLIGLVISISIFYMFQTLALNETFIKAHSMISAIQFVFHVGSVLLAFITLFYIFYANSFLLSLRRRELGMYMMLGAKKSKISQMLFIETLAAGVVSLVIGILAGAGLSGGLEMVLMNQLDIALEGYQPFYVPSLLMTGGFFLVLFLLTSTVNAIRLARSTELDLIRAEQKTDRIRGQGPLTVVTALLGIISIAIGYYALIHMEQLQLPGFVVATVTTTLGTYLVFISLLPVFVNRLKTNRKLNETRLNAFTFAQLRFRVNNLTRVLGTVAMLIALGVGAMTGGMAFQKNVELVTEIGRVYDIAIDQPEQADVEAMKTMTITEEQRYRYKADDKAIYFLKDDLLAQPLLVATVSPDHYDPEQKPERVTAQLPAPLYGMREDGQDKVEKMPEQWRKAMRNELSVSYEWNEGKAVRIAEQAIYQKVKGEEHTLLLARVDDFMKYKPVLKEIDKRQAARIAQAMKQAEGSQSKDERDVYLSTKYSFYENMYAFSSGTMFMGFFLGIAFLAMMASCLMFKILSGANQDQSRYSMLRKIGVRREWLVGSIYKELFVLFVFPALIGLAHVFVGMQMFSFILLEPYANIWLPVSIYLVIYTFYYLITVRLYRGIVLPKEA